MIGHRLSILMAMILFLSPAAPVGAGGDAPLPRDPQVVQGRVDSGARYLIKRHDAGSGRAWIRLIVEAGSLHERDDERGAADLISRLAYTSTNKRSTEEIRRALRDLGVALEADRRASHFTHAEYTLPIANIEGDALATALDVLSGVVGDLRLDDAAIERARREAVEEITLGRTAHSRVWAKLMPRLTSGSRLAERMPMACPEELKSLSADAVRSFYQRQYGAGSATVVIVGDVSPDAAIAAMDGTFGALARQDPPPAPDVGLSSYDTSFPVSVTDAGLPVAVVAAVRIGPWRQRVRTVADRREELVRDLARKVVDRHFDRCASCPQRAYRDVGVYLSQAFSVAEVAQVHGVAEPAQWREAMVDLFTDLRSLVEFGVQPCELDKTRHRMLEKAAERARNAATAPPLDALRELSRTVTSQRSPLSAQQDLELMRDLLPTITPEEVNQALRREFDLSRMAFVYEGPEGADAPDEPTVLAAATSARRAPIAPPEPGLDLAEAPGLLPVEPPAGQPVSMSIEPASQTLSAWLESGALVHHRAMQERPGRVAVAITLAGGQIEESNEQRGLTAAALTAFKKPATAWHTGAEMRELLEEASVEAHAEAALDAVSLRFEAPASSLDEALRLAHALLTSPRLEEAAFKSWKASELEHWRYRQDQPGRALDRVFTAALHPPHDRRIYPINKAEIERVTLDAAQAWLDRLVDTAPIEAAIVGDVSRPEALELAAKYLGSLPPRERIGPDTLDERRRLERRDPPYQATAAIETPEKHAVVMVARFGVDASQREAAQALSAASSVLDQRLAERMEAEPGFAIRAGGFNSPARVFPGFGLFGAWAVVEPGRAQRTANELGDALDALIQQGVVDEEVELAASNMADHLEAKMSEPSVWAARLARSLYKGPAPERLLAEPEQARQLTASAINAQLRNHVDAAAEAIRVIVAPAPPRQPAQAPPTPN